MKSLFVQLCEPITVSRKRLHARSPNPPRSKDDGVVEVPAAPNVTGVVPDSPANNNTPHFLGTTLANTVVKLFANSTCDGPVLAEGAANEIGDLDIETTVSDNSTTNVWAQAFNSAGKGSACSLSFVSYIEDSLAPTMPTLTGSTPSGTGNNNSPVFRGTAEPGSSVRLYSNDECNGTVLARGTVSDSGGFSMSVSLDDDSTVTVFAMAFDEAGNASPCSETSVSYIEDSTPPLLSRSF